MSARYTKRERTAACFILAEWSRRTPRVPELLTAHEAHRLTAGALGTEGDHGASGAVRRIDAALALARAGQGVSRR